MAWGWSAGTGLVFGLSLSVASTVVVLKALEERNLLNAPHGRVAVGWLITEDLTMVLALVLLPAFATMLGAEGGAWRRRGRRHGAGRHRCLHAAQGGRLRRHGDPARAARRAVASDDGRPHRLARAVHAVGAGHRARHRLRLGADLRRVLRHRRLLRRRGDERIASQPSRRGRFAAAAERLLGAVLHLRRHAVRPGDPGPRAGSGARRRGADHLRQGVQRADDHPRHALPVAARPGGGVEPGADRRILVHPGRARGRPGRAAARGPGPHPGRRHPGDHPQPA